MIYRALTPVANVFGEGTRRPVVQVDSVDQITFRATTKWIRVSTWRLFDLLLFVCLVGSFSSNVKFLLFLMMNKKKERKRKVVCITSLWLFNAFTLTMPSGGNKEF